MFIRYFWKGRFLMKKRRNERSIEQQLHLLVDQMVLKPERKKLAVRAARKLLHESKVRNVKGLHKAMNQFLGLVLSGNHESHGSDD